MTARIGSLFAGYGGLEMGISSVLDAEPAWFSEIDKAPSKILAHHWPDVPNHGDITTIDWATVEQVDILCGGFPCQDVSTAGLRRGLKPGTRSGLWSHFALAIDQLRPELVIIENVRGLLSAEAHSDLEPDAWDLGEPERGRGPALRALGAVLGDLADLGYDAEWCGVRAADAGAPHGRFRVFIAARPADSDGQRYGRGKNGRGVGQLDRDDAGEARERERARGVAGDRDVAPTPDTDRRGPLRRDEFGSEQGNRAAPIDRPTTGPESPNPSRTPAPDTAHGHGHGGARDRGAEFANSGGFAPDAIWTALGGAPLARHPEDGVTDRTAHPRKAPIDGTAEPGEPDRGTRRLHAKTATKQTHIDWGVYGPAIDRWGTVIGRTAPAPTVTSAAGAPQLAASFVEWMMGLPKGHVTNTGLTRNEQLKTLGNGVVPQQAALAVSRLIA